jgi:Cu(I)/Ag(I) efflux system protein CusF
MFKKILTSLLVVAAFTMPTAVVSFAQSNETNGEVLKIDKEQGKITLRHGPIKNLDMDQMTMVFRVQESKLLDGIVVGDKVKFEADRVKGQITITKMKRDRK